MRGWRLRAGAVAAAALVFGLLALALFGIGGRDPALYPPRPGTATTTLFLVSNGFHSGLLLSRDAMASAATRDGLGRLRAVAERFGGYEWIETGWGEDRFYRSVPELTLASWRLGLRALFWPWNESVMHVVGVMGAPRASFPTADLVRIELSEAGFARLLASVEGSFAGPEGAPVELGQGLYGPSLFYRARGAFSLLNVCNHWTARQLGRAGLPVSPLVATLPGGLVRELAWRSGLGAEPKAVAELVTP